VESTIQRYGCIFPSPIGEMLTLYAGDGIVALALTEERGRTQVIQNLTKSFGEISFKEGNPSAFFGHIENGIRSCMIGFRHESFFAYGTSFQVLIWQTLMTVPFGKTLSYSALAEKVGYPRAVRAVASAVAKNPLAVVIPCHRIINKNGTVGEFRWGAKTKQKLLELERKE
jgi:O-6-methylguanine DNA methyltransferase